jgi:ketosteroid isomerase-like protein
MSEANVEVIRVWVEAWNSRDIDALRDLVDPDLILRTVKDWPEPGPYVGREAVMRFTEQLRETWDADTMEVIGDIRHAADRVVVRLSWHGVGRGPQSDLEITDVFTVRKGKIYEQEFFWDHAEALEAVGLLEPSNLELVRSIFAAWERGDYSSADWAHPEIELVFADGPSPGTWTGLTGLAKGWRSILSAWEEYRHEADDYRELDDERVLVLHHWSGRGKTSGLDVGRMRTQAAILFHVRDGKVTRLVGYFDRNRAFADLGLPSETDSPRT